MSPRVAVVIINWNGKHLLTQFMPSIVATQYPNFEIIVGDNNSTDGSVEYLRSTYPSVRVIVNGENYGFAGGYNKVLETIDADYFVLLNSDVEVTPNWIQPVVDLMETDPLIAVAHPKIKTFVQKDRFEYAGAAGGYIDMHGFTFCRGRLFDYTEVDTGQYDDAREIFWASGAALFIKKKYWQESGGLDADFFAHMEEIDLCWRLKNMGYKVMYCPDATIYHVGGGTLNADNPYKTYLNFRNNLFLLQKNLPLGDAWLRIFIRMGIDFIAWLKMIIDGKFKNAFAINKAHTHFLLKAFVTGRKRRGKELPLASHAGFYNGSVVFNYFVKGNKHLNL